MVTREINLIHERKFFTASEEQFIHKIKKITVFVLGIFIFIIALTFGGSYYVNTTLAKLDQNIASEKEQIQSKVKDENRYLLVKQKAGALSQIFKAQFPYPDFFDFLKSLTGPDVKMTSISLNTAGEIILSVQIKNTEVLDTYIESILAESGKRFQQIDLLSIDFKDGNNIIIQLGLNSQTKS